MEELRSILKEALFERAARLAVAAEGNDPRWQAASARYHEIMDGLDEQVGEKTVLEWEDAAHFAHLHSETFMYWQGVLDGAALAKLLQL